MPVYLNTVRLCLITIKSQEVSGDGIWAWAWDHRGRSSGPWYSHSWQAYWSLEGFLVCHFSIGYLWAFWKMFHILSYHKGLIFPQGGIKLTYLVNVKGRTHAFLSCRPLYITYLYGCIWISFSTFDVFKCWFEILVQAFLPLPLVVLPSLHIPSLESTLYKMRFLDVSELERSGCVYTLGSPVVAHICS